IEVKQAAELAAIDAQYSEKQKGEEEFQRLLTAIEVRHESERSKLVQTNLQKELNARTKAQEDYFKRISQLSIDSSESAIERLNQESAKSLSIAQEQYNQGLIDEEQFQIEKNLIVDKYNKQREALDTASSAASANAYISAFNTIGASLDSLAEENDAFAKTAFIVNQAAAFAQAIVNAHLGFTKANTIDPTGTLGAVTLSAGYASAGIIAGQTIAGVFHDGTDAVPDSLNNSSFLLKAGERVVQPSANKELTQFLEDQKNGKGSGNTSVINANMTVNGQVTDEAWFNKQLIKQRNTIYSAYSKVDRERPLKRKR
ncbi:hypothetical protein VII00023_16741, partial [Vibrio ichthyoenteri ATCC 700023]